MTHLAPHWNQQLRSARKQFASTVIRFLSLRVRRFGVGTWLPVLCLLVLALPCAGQPGKPDYLVYAGTYTRTASKGIYAWRFDPKSGKLMALGLMAETAHPSFLAIHPNPRFLYATNEHETTAEPGNTISAYAMDTATGNVADLGTDQVFSYRFDPAKATLTENNPPFLRLTRGWGPRHLAFHPNGKLVFLVSEIGSRLTSLHYDAATGTLTELESVSTLAPDFAGPNSAAEVQVDRSGKFVYASNRGDNSIAMFSTDPAKGTMSLVEHVSTQGKTPRNFSLDPTGGWLFAANQDSDSIAIYRVDSKTGRLTPTGDLLKDAPEPSQVLFVSAR